MTFNDNEWRDEIRGRVSNSHIKESPASPGFVIESISMLTPLALHESADEECRNAARNDGFILISYLASMKPGCPTYAQLQFDNVTFRVTMRHDQEFQT